MITSNVLDVIINFIGTVILTIMYLFSATFGLWNIYSELKMGLKKMYAKDRRNIWAVRFILLGIFPLFIGLLSLIIMFTNPFKALSF